MLKKVYTTGEAAKILQCAPRTVSKAFDAGKLKGYRIPSSDDRRIPRDALLRFIRENHLFGERELFARVVLVGAAPLLAGRLRERLPEESYHLIESPDAFAAGRATSGMVDGLAVLDLSMGRSEGFNIARRINLLAPRVILAALANEDEMDLMALSWEYGFRLVLRHPVDPAVLAARIRALTEGEE
jgi:excisionase family DNA binding protein